MKSKNKQNFYKVKTAQFSGTNYHEIKTKILFFYHQIKKTKRRPYVKSFFNKDKIFLGLFWSHLYEKNFWNQARRMKLFGCGIELIKHSRLLPVSKENPNKKEEILHRFFGKTKDNEGFCVQIKEDKKKWSEIFNFCLSNRRFLKIKRKRPSANCSV